MGKAENKGVQSKTNGAAVTEELEGKAKKEAETTLKNNWKMQLSERKVSNQSVYGSNKCAQVFCQLDEKGSSSSHYSYN